MIGPSIIGQMPADPEPALALPLLAQRLQRDGDRFHLHGAAGWMQGRTVYGGASSFIAFTAARRTFPDLPPLRAAQIGFIGPVAEDMEAQVTLLRTGKSVSHVETSLYCAGTLAHRATWLFGRARAANGVRAADRLTEFGPPEAFATIGWSPDMPEFVQGMEIRRATPPDGIGFRRWIRLRDRGGIDPHAELIAIGDALPPGSMRAMERRGPISSINWSLTVLGETITTRDGWWLLESASNHMADGFSSETLRMWNTDGTEVMRGLQSVAIFG